MTCPHCDGTDTGLVDVVLGDQDGGRMCWHCYECGEEWEEET